MQIIEGKEQGYADWRAKNTDAYGNACFVYAEKWADLMEDAIEQGSKLEDVANQLSHDADTDGITGFMYGMAVGILASAWIYGERLRKWHNLKTQISNEGERANENGSVLNPAILNIG